MSSNDNNYMKKGGDPRAFDSYEAPFIPAQQEPYQAFSASSVSGKNEQAQRNAASGVNPTPITLPPHLFIPAEAQSIDIRVLANVPPATTRTLMTFKGRKGGLVTFIQYGVFFDALLFDLINLVPKVNGKRVFPLHGNPDQNFKIGLGTGADLSNSNLTSCQLYLQPNDLLTWEFTNDDTVDVAAGVRMVGYFDQTTIRKSTRVGG